MLEAVIERYVETLEPDDAGQVRFLDATIDRDDAVMAYGAEFIDATGIDALPVKIGEIVLSAMLVHGTHAALVLLDSALGVRMVNGVIDAETIAAAERVCINKFTDAYAAALKRHIARMAPAQEPVEEITEEPATPAKRGRRR